jgi:hypothetical protein
LQQLSSVARKLLACLRRTGLLILGVFRRLFGLPLDRFQFQFGESSMRTVLVCLAGCVLATNLHVYGAQPVDIPTRAKGADRVVLATVVDVNATFATTEHGDQIILSQVTLQIDDTLKGPSRDTQLTVDVEGGTVGDLTLGVSDMPSVRHGERAVFFLRVTAGRHVPHLRGQGIIKLQPDDSVQGTSLTLDAIRSMVRGAQQ